MRKDRRVRARLLIIAGVLAGGIVLLRTAARSERVPPHRPLREFPAMLGRWQGQDQPLTARIVTAVGVDQYVNRLYASADGSAVQLYIGYYESQRTGEVVHSPKNCLPGAGWEPVRAGELALEIPGRAPVVVNDYTIAKGRSRQTVFYWYQARGRTMASEYWAKLWMVRDAILRNRTDGALVRVVTADAGSEARERERALEFVRVLYPVLESFIPN